MWIKYHLTIPNYLGQVHQPTNSAEVRRGSKEEYNQERRTEERGGEREGLLGEELCLQELFEEGEGFLCSDRAWEVMCRTQQTSGSRGRRGRRSSYCRSAILTWQLQAASGAPSAVGWCGPTPPHPGPPEAASPHTPEQPLEGDCSSWCRSPSTSGWVGYKLQNSLIFPDVKLGKAARWYSIFQVFVKRSVALVLMWCVRLLHMAIFLSHMQYICQTVKTCGGNVFTRHLDRRG